MLYIIGLGLNTEGMSAEGKEIIKTAKKIYLEGYTVDFPYTMGELDEIIQKKIHVLNREDVESLQFIDEARRGNIAFLVYGNPLTATTHITIYDECIKSGIKCKIIQAASILDAVGETGLQIYKFGKIASMPKWNVKKHFTPDSFMEILKQNRSIDAHSLILADIGLDFQDALKQLEISAKKHEFEIKELVVCQCLGSKHSKIFYESFEKFKEFTGIRLPYCIIIPGKMHFVESDFLNAYAR